MQIKTINTGLFKLDGGAMFGVVPKSIWNKINPADANNMCTWAMRCMLIEDGDQLILIDTGIGNKQSEKFYGYYDLSGDNDILSNISKAGYTPNEITDVILTHLHFDHCGGAVSLDKSTGIYQPTFANAKYHTHKKHWQHAMSPNPREKPSFLKENFEVLATSGQLVYSDEKTKISNNVSLKVVSGHTESMFIPRIDTGNEIIYYCADLIPSVGHIKVNYVMAYDIEPLRSMTERQAFLDTALLENAKLFLEHDPNIACVNIKADERGAATIDGEFMIG